MTEWRKARLGDICEISAGGDRPQLVSDKETDICHVPIYSNGVDNDGLYGFTDKEKIKGDSITITARGANVGTVFYRKTAYYPIIRLLSLQPNEELVNSRYLYYLIKDKTFLSTGSAQPQITVPNISKYVIEYDPDVVVQHRIAEALSRYDALIENYQRQIKLLEEAAQRLYKEWFVDLRFPGHQSTPIINNLPQSWKKKKITDILDIKYGKDHKKLKDGPIPVYGTGGIMRYADSCLYCGESVLIPRKGSLNNIMLVNGSFWTIDTMFYSIPKIENAAKIAYFYLKDLDMYSFNIGAAVPSMTINILSGMEISLPTDEIRSEFECTVDNYYQQIALLENQIRNLSEARDRLLPKLMSAEIEV